MAVAFSSGSHVLRLAALGREQVVVVAEDEAVLRLDVLQRVVELGVDQQHPGAGVLDDVGDLVAAGAGS